MGPRKKDVGGPPSLAERIKASNNSPLEQSERVPRKLDLHKEVRKFIRLYCREVAIQPSILVSIQEARSTNQYIMELYNKESKTHNELEKQSSNIAEDINKHKHIDEEYTSGKKSHGDNHTKVKSTRRLNKSNSDGKTLAEMVNTTEIHSHQASVSDDIVRKKYTEDNLDVLKNIEENTVSITVENTNHSSSVLAVHIERNNAVSPDKFVSNLEYDENTHGDTENILSKESQQSLINTHNTNSPNCNNMKNSSDSCDKISPEVNPSLLDTSEKIISSDENSNDSHNNITMKTNIIGCRRPLIPRYRAPDKQSVIPINYPIPPDLNSLDVRSSSSLSSLAAVVPLSKTGETHTARTDDTNPSKPTALEWQKTEANSINHQMYAKTLHDTLDDKQAWHPQIRIPTSQKKQERVPGHRRYEINALTERYFSDTHLTKNGKQNSQRQKYYAFGSTIMKSGQSEKINSSRKRLSQLIGGQSRNKVIQSQLKKFGDTEFARRSHESDSVESDVIVPRYTMTALNHCFLDDKSGLTVQSDPYHEYPQKLSWFLKSGVVEVDDRYTFEEKKQTKSKAYRMIQQQHINRMSSETLPSSNTNYNIIPSVKCSKPKRVRFKMNLRTKPIAKQKPFMTVG